MPSAIEDYHAKRIAYDEADQALREIATQLRAIAERLEDDPWTLLKPVILYPVDTGEKKTHRQIVEEANRRLEEQARISLMPSPDQVRAAITEAQLAKARLQTTFHALSEIERRYVDHDLEDEPPNA